MTWLAELDDELAARGVTGPKHRRIVLELQDHVACDPGCEDRLGNPRDLAARFADELATDGARRLAYSTFGALASTGLVLIVFQFALRHAGNYGFERGHSLALFAPAALAIFVAPQAALVAGTLAVLRALHRRRTRTLPAAEIALIRRRIGVALVAGIATGVGLELFVIDFSSLLPAWWVDLFGGLAGVAIVALLAVAAKLVRTRSIVTHTSGVAGDVFDDVPAFGWHRLRRHPWWLGAIASLGVALAMTLVEWHAEQSLVEGLQRGVFEGLAAGAGFVLLGRAIGVKTAARLKVPTAHESVSP